MARRDVEIRIFSSLAEVDEHRWNRVTPSTSFRSSYEWLRCVEAGPFDARRAFVVAQEGDEYVGRFAMYLMGEEDYYLINPPMAILGEQLDVYIRQYWDEDEARRVAELRAALWEHKDSAYPCAVCVSPFADRFAFETRPDRDDVCELLIDAFFDVARDWQARSHGFLYVPAAGYESLTTRLVDERAFRDTQLGAVSLMSVPASFDDYLTQMSSSRRYAVRRELKGFAQSDLTLEVVDGTEVDERLVRRFATLSALTRARYGHPLDPRRDEAVLRAVLDTLGDRARFFVISREQQPLSYFRCFEWEATLHAAAVGQDHEALDPRSYAHFTAMYYGPLRYAIERGLALIDFGYTTKTKAQRGARSQPLTAYVRFDHLDDSRMTQLIDLINVAQRRLREDHG